MSDTTTRWPDHARPTRSVVIGIAAYILLVLACLDAGASEAGKAQNQWTDTVARQLRVSGDPVRAALESLSEMEMKEFYIRCSSAAMQRSLDGHEAAACSIGYDILLKQHFDGDFHALLAWSRRHRDASPAPGVEL